MTSSFVRDEPLQRVPVEPTSAKKPALSAVRDLRIECKVGVLGCSQCNILSSAVYLFDTAYCDGVCPVCNRQLETARAHMCG